MFLDLITECRRALIEEPSLRGATEKYKSGGHVPGRVVVGPDRSVKMVPSGGSDVGVYRAPKKKPKEKSEYGSPGMTL